MEESKLDILCSERDVYRRDYEWVTYGDYVNKIIPKLSREQRREIEEKAEILREARKSKKRGKKNVKSDKLHKHRKNISASEESQDGTWRSD